MHFDTIIIGGGLSGLVCGLRLQRGGMDCAIITSGQNAMHFSSGAFGLLGRDAKGQRISEPLSAIDGLPEAHPYRRIGVRRLKDYMSQTKTFFRQAGVELVGDEFRNSYMLSPTGNVKTAWLAMKDVCLLPSEKAPIGESALVVNLRGYLDFNTVFVTDGIERLGTSCHVGRIEMPEIQQLRSNPTEMRSVNLARAFDDKTILSAFIEKVKGLYAGEEVIVLPAVFGLKDSVAVEVLRLSLPAKVIFVGTMPPSIPGIRSQERLKKAFKASGGTFLGGDEVRSAQIEGDEVVCVHSANLDGLPLTADHYVVASGSFFSKGLHATPEKVIEPLMDLDVDFAPNRENWYDRDFFRPQNYLGFGVRTDENFQPYRQGRIVRNLYAIGSLLGGFNPLSLDCGAGTAIMTAFAVADRILKDNAEKRDCALEDAEAHSDTNL